MAPATMHCQPAQALVGPCCCCCGRLPFIHTIQQLLVVVTVLQLVLLMQQG
jgi:hypothetical protein